MNQKISLKKYLLTCALGFGLGGFLWGLVLYSELPDLKYPFHYMAIVVMGLLGGVSLVWFSKSIWQFSKSILAGLLGFGVGFVTTGIFVYPLGLYGTFILSIILPSTTNESFFELDPGIGISIFWLLFLLTGIITGLFYALFLKAKIWPLIWRGGVGFALGSLIGPIVGNLLGNLFGSLLISYLTTFSLMGIILGIFLSWGMYKSKELIS